MLQMPSQSGAILAHAVQGDEARCHSTLRRNPSPGDIVFKLAMIELNSLQEILLSILAARSTRM
jgi:hypothetical protein